MRWKRTTLALLGALLVPGASSALDLDGALGASVEYDSNVQRTDGPGQTDDVVFRITPRIRLLEDNGKFHWNIDYRLPYEFAVNTSRIDGLRHFLNAKGDFFASERTRLYGKNEFSKSDALSRTGGTTSDDIATVGSFRAPVWRNRAVLGVSHLFSPRVSSDLSFSYRYFDTELLNRSQTDVFAGNANISYMLTARHRLGGGVAGTFQDFAESNAGGRPASQTFFLNLFASWVWAIDETTNLEVTGGPTYIDTQQDAPPTVVSFAGVPTAGNVALAFDSCGDGGGESGEPVFQACSGALQLTPTFAANLPTLASQNLMFRPGQNPGEIDSNDWNFFANLALSKRWTPVHDTRVSYRRTDSTSSGLGSSVLDAVTLTHAWRFAERWTTSFRADFTHRASTSEQSQTLVEVVGVNLEDGCVNPAGGTIDCLAAATNTDPLNPAAGQPTFLTTRSGNNAIDTNRWGMTAVLSHRLTRHLNLSLRYRFNQQISATGSLGNLSDFGDHLVTLGVQYDFDRYSLDKYVPW